MRWPGLVLLLAIAACDAGAPAPEAVLPPELLFPADAASVPSAVEFRWRRSEEATAYVIRVAGPNGVLAKQEMSGLAFIVKDLNVGTAYTWSVASVGAAGAEVWSAERSFHVDREAEPPGTVRLLAPLDNAKNQSLETAVSWEATPGATSYQLQVSLESRLLLLVVDLENIRETRFPIQGLVRTYPYWWRVRAFNAAGYGPWSPVWTFQVIN